MRMPSKSKILLKQTLNSSTDKMPTISKNFSLKYRKKNSVAKSSTLPNGSLSDIQTLSKNDILILVLCIIFINIVIFVKTTQQDDSST